MPRQPIDRRIRMTAVLPKQATIDRAVKAVVKAGLTVGGIEIAPDGTVRVDTIEKTGHRDDDFEAWERASEDQHEGHSPG